MKRILLNLTAAAVLLSAASCSNERHADEMVKGESVAGADTMGVASAPSANTEPTGTDVAAGAMADPNGPMAPHKDDSEFMQSVAHSDQNEIQLSKLALEKGVTGMAKTHAEMMIADHTKSTADLQALAAKKSVTLPADMDAEHKTLAAAMRQLSGQELEKAFLDQMTTDHQKTLNTLAAHRAMTQDADLQGFIDKTTPVVASHLKMAKNHAGMM
jgi:putative membrane protein